MAGSEPLDDLDRRILDRLRANGRETGAEIAAHISLTPSAVRRRISRLEEAGVITGYTIAVDHDKIGPSIEAYVELFFPGDADVHSILGEAIARPEVREAMTLAGETDALLRVRVLHPAALRQLVADLRRSGAITNSRTRIVLGRWWHGSPPTDGGHKIA